MLASLAGKFGGYAIAAMIVFSAGFYAGRRWELPAVDAARAKLAAQVYADEQAAVTANLEAAKAIAAAKLQSDNAVSGHQAAVTAMLGRVADRRAAIATQAAQPGQDGPVAPVLEAVHDMLVQGTTR